MSIPEQQWQNHCSCYPNIPENYSGIASDTNYPWSQHGTGSLTSGGALQRQSSTESESCSPVASTSSICGYYENQRTEDMQLQMRLCAAGESVLKNFLGR